MARFPYPVRPIHYLAVCYLFISLVYMIGLVAEDKISCSAISASNSPLVSQGIDSFACTVIAVTHYYFRLVSLIILISDHLADNLVDNTMTNRINLLLISEICIQKFCK